MINKTLLKEFISIGRSPVSCRTCHAWKGEDYCAGNTCPSKGSYIASLVKESPEALGETITAAECIFTLWRDVK